MKSQNKNLETRKAELERQKAETRRELGRLNLIKSDAAEMGGADEFFKSLCKETWALNLKILACNKEIRAIDAELAATA